MNKVIDYTKTFENYTLLSALRELFDGYNFSVKAKLIKVGSYFTKMQLIFVSKTGVGTEVLSDNVFQSVKQTRTIDKESYGTVVVSNAENVVSTKAKTFPSVGTIRLSSDSLYINRDNAVLRLPTNIYQLNWIQMVSPTSLEFFNFDPDIGNIEYWFYEDNYEEIKNSIIGYANNYLVGDRKQELIDRASDIASDVVLGMRTTFKTGWRYNALDNNYVPPQNDNSFYFPRFRVYNGLVYQFEGKCGINLKEIRDTVLYKVGIMSYQQGNDTIENFGFLASVGTTYTSYFTDDGYRGYLSTDLQKSPTLYEISGVVRISLGDKSSAVLSKSLNTSNVGFRVNYIPMSDLKIKYDNASENRDIQLYNQNGKLNDSVALSKLMLSYSKEIESDNITRFGVYYDIENVPQVGSMVLIDNAVYVINNVSLDFYENEDKTSDYGLYIVGEFTLSKKVATKSLMVNPNNNIRDYGIPQNMNVKRKQLYRDFYELAHELDTNQDNEYYLKLSNFINFSISNIPNKEHIAVMKLQYDNAYGGDSANDIQPSNTWYYQLDTTTFIMKKAIYEVLDFKDNNIIGYGNQNVSSAWRLESVLSGAIDNINTPISYVDDYGKVKDIDICFCDIDQIQEIYDQYKEDVGFTRDISLYNYSVFIPQNIYDLAESNNDFAINEDNYNKDSTEVPVFEYSCQLDDGDDVIVGDNIFDNLLNEHQGYLYTYVLAPKNAINENNFGTLDIEDVEWGAVNTSLRLLNVAQLEISTNYVDMKLYLESNTTYYNKSITSQSFNYEQTISGIDWTKYDLVIIRKNIDIDESTATYTINQTNDLLFVVRNMENVNIPLGQNKVRLTINHYRIK